MLHKKTKKQEKEGDGQGEKKKKKEKENCTINHPAKGQAPPEGITPLGILRMMSRACDGLIL